MTITFAILSAVFLGLFIFELLKRTRFQNALAQREMEVTQARQEAHNARTRYESESVLIHGELEATISRAQNLADRRVAEAQADAERVRSHCEAELLRIHNEAQLLIDQQLAEIRQESERVRCHYEIEARQIQCAADALVTETVKNYEPLRQYEAMRDAGADTQRILADAFKEATSLRAEAQALIEYTRNAVTSERSEASRKAKELRVQADAILDQATRDAGRIVEEAHKRAEQIGGDAYLALRDKQTLEQAVNALWNVVEGYGDRYIVPTRSLLDDLASDFGHTEAGEALRAAREQSRRMVEEKQAGACNYVEEDRRERANRFVTDAFNGRVDAILSRTKHDNYGTLEQEIRDAFSLVNLNGVAFRDARILPAYLDARLAELKWAVVAQELKLKAREEQRRIQEQIREEEKVRREQERAIRDAQDKEEAIKSALEKARLEAEHSTVQERAKYDAQIAELSQRLADAEAVKEREISMAQLTRAGNVYIISNVGSFGEEVFKIGMTRRREPMDRIWELGDASVPFDFDVHAMIYSEDAPALERMLHNEFDDLRINKVNFRKEFFRLPVERIRNAVVTKNLNATFTLVAEAREYRETLALDKMTPAEREKYHLRSSSEEDTPTE